MRNKIITVLDELTSRPPTKVNYAEHRTRIDNWLLEGNKILFVAHSQGNLFANAAYQYAVSKAGYNSVGLVHVAPPTSFLNGQHTLADLDLVIRILDDIPSVTDEIPLFGRPPGANGKRDLLGHGFVEIYINRHFTTSQRIRNDMNNAILSLVNPRREAFSELFTTFIVQEEVRLSVFVKSFAPSYLEQFSI